MFFVLRRSLVCFRVPVHLFLYIHTGDPGCAGASMPSCLLLPQSPQGQLSPEKDTSFPQCSSSNLASRRQLSSSSKPAASREKREEMRRAQQLLLEGPTVQQLLHQTHKGLKKLFEAFSSGDTLNQKAWGRFSLFVNLAPSTQMLCFFKQGHLSADADSAKNATVAIFLFLGQICLTP